MRRNYSDLSTKKVTLGRHTLPLGFGNFVLLAHVQAIQEPDSNPALIVRQKAKEEGRLLNVTHGRPMRAMVITDSNHVILTAVSPETLQARIEVMENENLPLQNR